MAQPWLSVVIPTYNEAANIGPLLVALREALGTVEHELIVVDDDSKDATVANARAASPLARIIVRKGERGLATAVVRGLREARGTHVAVMDADFQHPPEAVRRMFDVAVATDSDLVIGSRYAKGGSEGDFGPFRKLLSWGAGTIGKLALPPIRRFKVTDPMSGLFLVRRDRVDPDALRPHGYKILLEILGRCPLERVAEVPYTFQDRRGGDSKLGPAVIVDYLRHVADLGVGHPENRRIAKFGLVGLSGVVVNLVLLYVLHGVLRLHDLIAVPLAVEASILSNFVLNDRFTFHDRQQGGRLGRALKFNAVSLVALLVNLLAYTILAKGMGVQYLVAEAIAILVAFGANYTGNMTWTYGGAEGFSLRRAGRGMLPFVPVLLVTAAAGTVYVWDVDRPHEIYFDEHYYVSIARQMDNGIWEDPCWTYDSLSRRPLNYEHPPLAKLLIYWSVAELDTDHAVFQGDDPGPEHRQPGCRNPDDTQLFTGGGVCNLVEHGEVLSSYDNNKACYDAFTARAKAEGNPLAWRLPSVVFGTLAVLFTGLAAQRIFGTVFAGALASTLVLLDTLVLGASRIALLDIFAAGFTMAAVWAATFPTKRGIVGSAVLLGLGFASKYSVVFAGPGVLALLFWTHRRAGAMTRRRFDLAIASYIVLPLVVWVASYWPWWNLWIRDQGLGWAARHWYDIQKAAFGWGVSGYASHPYSSPPGQWFTMAKPTWYYHVWGLPDGKEGWVYSIGNPALWWIAAVVVVGALLAVPLRWLWRLRGSEPRTALGVTTTVKVVPMSPRAQAIILTSLLPAVAYGGFFLVDRATFLFYMALVVPLLCLPLAGALDALWRRGLPARLVVAGALAAILIGFVVYYPLVVAAPLSCEQYQDIMDLLPWMKREPCAGA